MHKYLNGSPRKSNMLHQRPERPAGKSAGLAYFNHSLSSSAAAHSLPLLEASSF
jgi:hypothetical protein